jgi:hypothetical protein
VIPLAKPIGEKLTRLEGANESSGAENVLARLSRPASVGLTDNMLSRTDLQISGFALPHGKPSSAPMLLWLCVMAAFIEFRPEQACAIEIKTNAKVTINAAIRESVLGMVDSSFLFKG